MSVGDTLCGRRLALVAGLAPLLALSASSAALATQRYATPTGSPTGPCTRAKPCDFATAVEAAADGDWVIVARGSYNLGAVPVTDTAAISITGITGAARPRLRSSVAGAAALSVENAGSAVSFLEIDAPAGTGLSLTGGSAEQIVARAGGLPGGACAIGAATLRDSVCASSEAGGTAVLSQDSGAGGAELRNVTALAGGAGGTGVEARASQSGADEQLRLVNVIARGAAHDIAAAAALGAGCAVSVTHSNYATTAPQAPATISDDGTRQSAPPVFVDGAAQNYHQARNSPTVDHGLGDPRNGRFDVDGDARTVHGVTDIGADELDLPPAPSTRAASPVDPLDATLRGSVNSDGPPTEVAFQYGKSRRYGSQARYGQLGPIGDPAPVAVALAGLTPGTVYHYRVLATNAQGVRHGRDVAFATPPLELTRLRQARPRWREPAGTAFSFSLNAPAKVVFTFTRLVPGRRTAGQCRPRRRPGHGGQCTLLRGAGSITVHGRLGADTVAFRGRLPGRGWLRPGRYSVSVVPRANGAIGQAHRLMFTIAR